MNRFNAVLAIPLACLAASASARPDPAIQQRIAALAIPFVPNAGQWDSRAAFAAQLSAGMLFVTGDGQLVYRLPGIAGDGTGKPNAADFRQPPAMRDAIAAAASRGPGWVLTETLLDAGGRPLPATPRGDGVLDGRVSYSLGNDESRHRSGLPTFERVNLGDVYPGINVQLRATGSNVEKIFTIAAAHDPKPIRIQLSGAERLELGSAGELIAHTGNGPVSYTAPLAYQEDAAGKRAAVPVSYKLHAATSTYGFAVGPHDSGRALVIDPLLQSTYLGGNAIDIALAMAVHPATGEVYVAGITSSTNFPKTAGAEQPALVGPLNAFVTRLSPTLTTRLQSTYLGGTGGEFAYALAIHPQTGDVYIAGDTKSTDLAKVAGAEQTTHAADSANFDAFVSRLDASLTSVIRSTYLGGNGEDIAYALAIHPATGEIYVAGQTKSTDFPRVAGAEQPAKGGDANDVDAFVTRLDAALSTRVQSTYIGGTGSDEAFALAIHPATGDVYVAGYTASSDFPKVTGAEQTVKGAGTDAFVTRLNAALTLRQQSTFIGGNGGDNGTALAIHPATGEIYVAGYTLSTDFPKVAGAEQTVKGAAADTFVTRLNPALTIRLQSTYVGGNGDDTGQALAIHALTGDVYVGGGTNSTDFPKVTSAAQAVKGTGNDAFVTRLNAALTTRLQSTYLGGSGEDYIHAMAIHPSSGNVYVAGQTTSTNFPNVVGSEQTTHGVDGGLDDGFVSVYSLDLLATDVVPNAFSFPPRLNVQPGSLQASSAAQILGITGLVPISVSGGAFAQYCVSSTATCGCDIVAFTFVPGIIAINQFVCVRQQAPFATPAVGIATVIVGGGVGQFLVATGNGLTACSLDIDGNGARDALTDGLMLLRAMFGLTGTSVTSNAVGVGATRTSWAQIQAYLNGNCGTSFAP
ncbi:MAG: SBBP repeat-containing protein [Betaproteobacteria bacterium]